MREKIFIRADANSSVGWGHLIRTLALADVLASVFEPVFVVRATEAGGVALVNESGWECVTIGDEDDFRELLQTGQKIVLDGYDFTSHYCASLKARGAKIISIQDVCQFQEHVDLIVNHLPGNFHSYAPDTTTRVLCGAQYALVRSAFYKTPRRAPSPTTSCMISLGATVSDSALREIIAVVSGLYPDLILNVIARGAPDNISGDVKFHWGIKASCMVDFIDRSSFCIATPGNISYEIFYRNRLAILGSLNDAQRTVGESFAENGLARYVGDWRQPTAMDNLARYLQEPWHPPESVISSFGDRSTEAIRREVEML